MCELCKKRLASPCRQIAASVVLSLACSSPRLDQQNDVYLRLATFIWSRKYCMRRAQGASPRQWVYMNLILEHASAFVPVSMLLPPEAPPGMCCLQLQPLCSPHLSSPPKR